MKTKVRCQYCGKMLEAKDSCEVKITSMEALRRMDFDNASTWKTFCSGTDCAMLYQSRRSY